MPAVGPDIDIDVLRRVGIRPTSQRLVICRAIRSGGGRHLTPEGLHRELAQAGLKVALGTIYSTLHQFAAAGLLRRVGCGEPAVYCTRRDEHHHFVNEETGELEDILGPQPMVIGLPAAAPGFQVVGVDVLVRVRRTV